MNNTNYGNATGSSNSFISSIKRFINTYIVNKREEKPSPFAQPKTTSNATLSIFMPTSTSRTIDADVASSSGEFVPGQSDTNDSNKPIQALQPISFPDHGKIDTTTTDNANERAGNHDTENNVAPIDWVSVDKLVDNSYKLWLQGKDTEHRKEAVRDGERKLKEVDNLVRIQDKIEGLRKTLKEKENEKLARIRERNKERNKVSERQVS